MSEEEKNTELQFELEKYKKLFQKALEDDVTTSHELMKCKKYKEANKKAIEFINEHGYKGYGNGSQLNSWEIRDLLEILEVNSE